MCPIRIRDLTQHDPGTGSSPWAARDRDFWTAHVKDRADQFMHHLKSKSDIIGLDAIAAAGEDGDGRLDDKANRTNRPSGSKRRQSRAAGRLGGDGDFEAVRKRGKGSGGLVSAGRGIYQAKSASNGQETAVAQTDLVVMDDCTSVNTAEFIAQIFRAPKQRREGQGKGQGLG